MDYPGPDPVITELQRRQASDLEWLQRQESKKNMTTEDDVNHPTHYTSHPSGVECNQIVSAMTYNIGSAVAYLWRAGLKESVPGDLKASHVKDLRKAIWHIEREIERIKGVKPVTEPKGDVVAVLEHIEREVERIRAGRVNQGSVLRKRRGPGEPLGDGEGTCANIEDDAERQKVVALLEELMGPAKTDAETDWTWCYLNGAPAMRLLGDNNRGCPETCTQVIERIKECFLRDYERPNFIMTLGTVNSKWTLSAQFKGAHWEEFVMGDLGFQISRALDFKRHEEKKARK